MTRSWFKKRRLREFAVLLGISLGASWWVGSLASSTDLGSACAKLREEISLISEKRRERELPHELALDLLQLFAKTAHLNGCHQAAGMIASNLGGWMTAQGELLTALSYFDQADRLYALATDPGPKEAERQLKLDQNKGTVYLYLGWLEDAEETLRDVLSRWRSLDDLKGIGETQMQLSRVMRLSGNLELASASIQEASQVLDELLPLTRVSVWQEMARVDLAMGRPQEADLHLQRGLVDVEKGSEIEQILFLDRVESLLAQGRWLDSESLLKQIRSGRNEAEQNRFYFEAHQLFLESRVLTMLGRLDEAIALSDRSLVLLNGFRQAWQEAGADLVALRRKTEQHRFGLAVEHQDAMEALRVFEQHKALGFQASLWLQGVGVSKYSDQDTTACSSTEAAWRLDQGPNKNPHEERRRRRELFECTRGQRRVTTDARAYGWEVNLNTLKADFGPTPVMVLAMAIERPYVIWWAPGSEPVAYGVDISNAELEQLSDLSALERALSSTKPNELLNRIGAAVLTPMLSDLDGYSDVWIVADGALDGFPLGLLTRPDSGESLFSTHAIAFLPSMTSLRLIRDSVQMTESTRQRVLALGDPIFSSRGDTRWPEGVLDARTDEDSLASRRLAKSADEVRELVAIHRRWGREGKVLLGKEATRQKLIEQASRHGIIHLATHAESDLEIPERSRIRLSCLDPEEQSVRRCDLYLSDISDLDLKGQLVVLSTCESHVGRRRAGEGPLGLSRAFLAAEASVVIASLWEIPDGEATKLMVGFHGYLAQGFSVAQALRLAKMDARKEKVAAKAWAGFVVYGDGAMRLPRGAMIGRF